MDKLVVYGLIAFVLLGIVAIFNKCPSVWEWDIRTFNKGDF